ncbi:MAG: response regulator [Caldilinea sp.]|nr:response regulator [Caldilinea sp.]
MSSKIASLLLLEPDRATRQLYARELGKRWRVVTVERASEALDILATEAIGAVILEFSVVDADQWQLLTQIRQQLGHATLPIIICSAVDERGKGYELGASAYLVKPVSPHQLSGEVSRWIDGQFKAEGSR